MELLKIVVVGHVDHGKSTVIGKLLYDTNSLPEGAVEKVKRIAKETGKPFEYAYLLDAFEEEQKQGITIDTTSIQFNTEKREYVIIDAPGHKEFLKNMISGAADAEAALLIIDGKQGVQEQSKRHAYILSLLGINRVHVIVNKMDLVNYSEDIFNKVKEDMNKFLKDLNVYPLSYIPISAFYGENILISSDKLPWYRGKNLIDSIDSIEKEKSLDEKPLRFPIQDVYKFDDRRIIAGRIESGKISVGDKISIYPEGKKTTVKSIEYWAPSDNKNIAFAGESIGITVSDEFFNKRGEVIAFDSNPPKVSNRFRANVFWMGKTDLVKNKKYKIKITTEEVYGEIEEIIRVIDASTLDSGKENSKVILNDVAEVIIKLDNEIAYDTFTNINKVGRFVIVDGYDVAGGGIITKYEDAISEELKIGFKYNNSIVHGDIFEEYFYSEDDFNLIKEYNNNKLYEENDEVPLKGISYEYPSSLDVLIFRDNVSVKIRDGIIEKILPINQYKYEGYPLVNGRGFGLRINNEKDFNNLYELYENNGLKKNSEFDKILYSWIIVDKYRSIALYSNFI